jgi:hypothetical protein
MTTKNAGKLLVISIDKQMRRYKRGTSPDEERPGLHSKPLDAAIGRVIHFDC